MATFSFLTPHTIPVVGVNCLGRCNKGPNCRILTPEGAFQGDTIISFQNFQNCSSFAFRGFDGSIG